MASHQQYKNFVKKYNSEFGFRGYTKLKKQELINKIESVLSKSRKEIKDEYKKLKEMKKEAKPKPAPKPAAKPKPKPAAKPKPAPKPAAKPTPKPKPTPKKKVVPKKAHNKFMKDLREQPINQTQVDKLDKPNINITKLEGRGFNILAHYKQDGKKMVPLRIPLNVSNPELLKPEKERKKPAAKPKPTPKPAAKPKPTPGKPIEDQNKLLEPVYKQLTKFIDDLKPDKSKITVAKLDKFYKDNKYNIPSDKKISSYDIVDNNRDLDLENTFIGAATIFLPLDIKQKLVKRFPSKSKIIKDKFKMEDLYYYLFADPRQLTTHIKDFYTFDNKIKNNLDKLNPADTEFINDYLRFRSYLTAQKPFIVYNKFITDKLKKADYNFDPNDTNIMAIMKRIKN
jgi:hypothetical protein